MEKKIICYLFDILTIDGGPFRAIYSNLKAVPSLSLLFINTENSMKKWILFLKKITDTF